MDRLILLGLVGLVGLACEPSMPDLAELECGSWVYAVETPPAGRCMRLDATGGARVRELGADGCDAWAECVALPGGQSAERGGNPVEPGHVLVSYWPCEQVPACDVYAVAPDGTSAARNVQNPPESSAAR
jgi:hypothetical protein